MIQGINQWQRSLSQARTPMAHNTSQQQHSTAQHSTAQHSTTQHNTTQHNARSKPSNNNDLVDNNKSKIKDDEDDNDDNNDKENEKFILRCQLRGSEDALIGKSSQN